MTKINITVATPAFGEIFYTPYVQSVLRLQRAMHRRAWTMRHTAISYAIVGEARNYLLTHWFDKTKDSHLLFVDADMGFESKLIFDMLELDKPVVGVVYAKRQLDLRRLAALSTKGVTAERAIARAHDFVVHPLRGRQPRRINGFIEVARCGTGIMLIRRDAIAAMLKRLPEVNDTNARKSSPISGDVNRLIRAFDTITIDGVPLADDFAFCHRWQALCKGELWACADELVTHVGLYRFGARYSDAAIGSPRIAMTIGKGVGLSATSASAGNLTSRRGNGARALALRARSAEKDSPGGS